MDEQNQILQWIVGSVLLLLIMYGFWNGASWLFEVLHLTPKNLALVSLSLTLIPFVLLIIFGMTGAKNAMHVSGALTILSFWLSGPGMVAAGVWFLLQG